MSERNGDLFIGLVIGGLIGAAIGILFAPKSGKETREDIANKADEVLAKAKEEYGKAVEKSKAAYDAAVLRLRDVEVSAKEKVSELASQGADVLQDNKNRLKKALDAGVEAYRQEKNKPV
jgi:gas vesicle protein